MSTYIKGNQSRSAVGSFIKDVKLKIPDMASMWAETPLSFTPEAKAKLEFFRDIGGTEITCFGVIRDDYVVEDIIIPKQECSVVSVDIDGEDLDDKIYEYEQDQKTKGRQLEPWQTSSVWIHTHPGTSPNPSSVDETQFKESSESLDSDLSDEGGFYVMYILAKHGEEYCRMKIKGKDTIIRMPTSVEEGEYELSDDQKEELTQIYKDCVTRPKPIVHTAKNTYGYSGFRYQNYQGGVVNNNYDYDTDVSDFPEKITEMIELTQELVNIWNKGKTGLDNIANSIKTIAGELYLANDSDVKEAHKNRKSAKWKMINKKYKIKAPLPYIETSEDYDPTDEKLEVQNWEIGEWAYVEYEDKDGKVCIEMGVIKDIEADDRCLVWINDDENKSQLYTSEELTEIE